MTERQISEEEIDKSLEGIMENHPDHTIKFLAKILFNCRYDINEMKLGLLKIFKPEAIEIEDEDRKDFGGFYS